MNATQQRSVYEIKGIDNDGNKNTEWVKADDEQQALKHYKEEMYPDMAVENIEEGRVPIDVEPTESNY